MLECLSLLTILLPANELKEGKELSNLLSTIGGLAALQHLHIDLSKNALSELQPS